MPHKDKSKRKEYIKQYHIKNKDRIRKMTEEYREDNPDKAKRICLTCKKVFETPNLRPQYSTCKYCQECRSKRISERQRGKDNPCWKNAIKKEELIELYKKKKMSIIKVSETTGIDRGVIRHRLKMWNIPMNDNSEMVSLGLANSDARKKFIESMITTGDSPNREKYLRIAKANYDWRCMICKKTKTNKDFDLVVHHMDGNNRNNLVENLMVLCQGCHTKIHTTGRIRKPNFLKCKFCGVEFRNKNSSRLRKYCSHACYHKHRNQKNARNKNK